jgi:hypothetical protein
MDDSRIPKKIYNYEAEGRRSVEDLGLDGRMKTTPMGSGTSQSMVSSYLDDDVVDRINVVLNDESRRSN